MLRIMTPHPAAVQIIALYERHAGLYDRERGRSLIEREWLDRFCAIAAANGMLLDLGCGPGEPLARELLARGYGVTGVDSSPAMIALCQTRFPPAHWPTSWIVGDMRALSLGQRFAGILAWDSFFHLTPADQRAMFPRFAAHAAPGAALMFTSGHHAGEAIGTLQGETLYHASLDPSEYQRLLTDNGFAVVHHVAEDPTCGAHTIWLARFKT